MTTALVCGAISLVTLFLVHWPFVNWIDWGPPGAIDVVIGAAAFVVLVAIDLAWSSRLRAAGSRHSFLEVPSPADRPWWIALSVATGLTEELTWRLVQPMVIMGFTGSAPLAIVLSAATFGVGHLRGGWTWAFITILFGLVLQAITLTLVGGWYIAAVVHVSINLASGLVPSFLERHGVTSQDAVVP